MSLIKGKLSCGTVRWLDPLTGKMYASEGATWSSSVGWLPTESASWSSGSMRFTSDAVPELAADWYVLRVVPDERRGLPSHLEGKLPDIFTAFGPYTEAEARANAAKRSEMSAGKSRTATPKPYAVVQVQAGNTVVVQPPAPPAAVAHWS